MNFQELFDNQEYLSSVIDNLPSINQEDYFKLSLDQQNSFLLDQNKCYGNKIITLIDKFNKFQSSEKKQDSNQIIKKYQEEKNQMLKEISQISEIILQTLQPLNQIGKIFDLPFESEYKEAPKIALNILSIIQNQKQDYNNNLESLKAHTQLSSIKSQKFNLNLQFSNTPTKLDFQSTNRGDYDQFLEDLIRCFDLVQFEIKDILLEKNKENKINHEFNNKQQNFMQKLGEEQKQKQVQQKEESLQVNELVQLYKDKYQEELKKNELWIDQSCKKEKQFDDCLQESFRLISILNGKILDNLSGDEQKGKFFYQQFCKLNEILIKVGELYPQTSKNQRETFKQIFNKSKSTDQLISPEKWKQNSQILKQREQNWREKSLDSGQKNIEKSSFMERSVSQNNLREKLFKDKNDFDALLNSTLVDQEEVKNKIKSQEILNKKYQNVANKFHSFKLVVRESIDRSMDNIKELMILADNSDVNYLIENIKNEMFSILEKTQNSIAEGIQNENALINQIEKQYLEEKEKWINKIQQNKLFFDEKCQKMAQEFSINFSKEIQKNQTQNNLRSNQKNIKQTSPYKNSTKKSPDEKQKQFYSNNSNQNNSFLQQNQVLSDNNKNMQRDIQVLRSNLLKIEKEMASKENEIQNLQRKLEEQKKINQQIQIQKQNQNLKKQNDNQFNLNHQRSQSALNLNLKEKEILEVNQIFHQGQFLSPQQQQKNNSPLTNKSQIQFSQEKQKQNFNQNNQEQIFQNQQKSNQQFSFRDLNENEEKLQDKIKEQIEFIRKLHNLVESQEKQLNNLQSNIKDLKDENRQQKEENQIKNQDIYKLQEINSEIIRQFELEKESKRNEVIKLNQIIEELEGFSTKQMEMIRNLEGKLKEEAEKGEGFIDQKTYKYLKEQNQNEIKFKNIENESLKLENKNFKEQIIQIEDILDKKERRIQEITLYLENQDDKNKKLNEIINITKKELKNSKEILYQKNNIIQQLEQEVEKQNKLMDIMQNHLEETLKELDQCQRQIIDLSEIREFSQELQEKYDHLLMLYQEIQKQSQIQKSSLIQNQEEIIQMQDYIEKQEIKLNDYQREIFRGKQIYEILEQKNHQLQKFIKN